MRRWTISAAGLLLAFLVLGGVLLAVGERNGDGRPAPAEAEIRRVHATMHAIDRVCAGGSAAPALRGRLEREARAVIGFARRYPVARFQIDGEDARATSLLLVARETLRRCAPGAAAIADGALPREFRRRP